MDVIDRYLRTLRILLPKDQRDDIIRELSEEMREQIADHERAAGRPLSAEEKGAIVGQFGHPLLTAARYRPQRSLIGPIVFPYYWLALKVTLGLVVSGHVAGGLILLGSGASSSELVPHINDAVASILKVAGWMTALAAWFDLWLSRSNVLKNWRPDLSSPPSRLADHAVASALSGLRGSNSHRSPTSPTPSASRLVLAAIVSVWWLAGLRSPALFFGSGAAHLDWGPAMDRLYPILVVAQLTMLVEQFVRLRAREAVVILGLTQVVWLVGGWALIYIVATSDHQWMVWRGEAAARAATFLHVAGRDISLLQFVNYVWSSIFVFVAGLGVWATLKAVARRIRRPTRHAFA